MKAPETDVLPNPSVTTEEPSRSLRALNWSSFGFALLQNICAAVLTINSVRVAIGVGSIAAASGVWPTIFRFHADAIRIPMMIIALVGAVINLAALWQIRRLRNRPAAQWRRVPLSASQKRSETFQLVLSILTLALLAFEAALHYVLHHPRG
jgi:hypothetical protein